MLVIFISKQVLYLIQHPTSNIQHPIMSILYHYKIKNLTVTQKPVNEIVNWSYHAMLDNFRTYLKKTTIDLKKEPAKIRIERFLELLKIVRDTEGVEALYNMATFSREREQESWKKLQESYRTGIDLLHSYRSLARNNMFHTIMNEEDKVLPVLIMQVEIISVHPDAGFPRYRMNPNVTMSDERRFLLRILSDALYTTHQESLLYKEAHKPTAWDPTQTGTDYRMDAEKIIWGFERHKGLKIKPSSTKAFWKKHQDQWWSVFKEYYFDYKSDNKPFELVKYDIMIHPGWEKEFTSLVDIPIDSTAYWS